MPAPVADAVSPALRACTCPSCIPWVQTRAGWLPFSASLWPSIINELTAEQAAKGCVFTFAIVEPGWWVAGDMSVADARALPVGGTA